MTDDYTPSDEPILACRAEMTPEILTEVYTLLMRKSKFLGIIFIATGGIFLLCAVSDIIGNFLSPAAYSDPFYPILFAITFIAVGIFTVVNTKKSVKRYSDAFIQLNKSPDVDIEFFERSFAFSNAISHQKVFYVDVYSWGEGKNVYYIFFCSPYCSKTFFVPKAVFTCEDDKNRFLSLMQTALAGKEFRKY